jgi:hypothetical protein
MMTLRYNKDWRNRGGRIEKEERDGEVGCEIETRREGERAREKGRE